MLNDGALPHHLVEAGLELIRTTHFDEKGFDTQFWCHRSPLFEIGEMGGVVRIPEKGYARNTGNELLEKLYPLGAHFGAENGIAGDISPRVRQARHESRPYGIADADHHDRNRRRRLLGGSSSSAAGGGNNIHWNAGEIACNGGKPVGLPFRRPIFKSNISTFDVSEFAQSSPKMVPDRRIIDDADAGNLRRSLLRPRRQRPSCRCTGEQSDELAPLHGACPKARDHGLSIAGQARASQ